MWDNAGPCLSVIAGVSRGDGNVDGVDKSDIIEEGILEKLMEIIDHCVKQDDQAFIDEPELLTLLDGTMKTVESMRHDPMLCR